MQRTQKELQGFYGVSSTPLLIGGCAALPLKLSVAYAFFIPLLVLKLGAILGSRDAQKRFQARLRSSLVAPLALFLAHSVFAAMLGIAPLESLKGSLSLASSVLLLFIACDVAAKGHSVSLVVAILLGQSVAATYSVFESAYPTTFPRLFLGSVTESGQLALTTLFGLALVAQWRDLSHEVPVIAIFCSLLGLVSLGLNYWLAATIGIPPFFLAAGGILLFLSASLFVLQRALFLPQSRRWVFIVASLTLPLLGAALVLNLKRGPWAGVLVGSSLLLIIRRERKLLLLLLLSALAITTLGPVMARVRSALDHFFIPGGRSEIWEIGFNLITRFPLGVGLENSDVLQRFSESIPPNLRHFHSNSINLLAETGWIGLALFTYWWLGLVRSGLSLASQQASDGLLLLGISCALISWQVAGLFEYNAGDSEIWYLVLIASGILLAKQEMALPEAEIVPLKPPTESEQPAFLESAQSH